MTKHTYGAVPPNETSGNNTQIEINNSESESTSRYPRIWRGLIGATTLDAIVFIIFIALLKSNTGNDGTNKTGTMISGFLGISLLSCLLIAALKTKRLTLPGCVEKYCCTGLDGKGFDEEEDVLWSSTTGNPAFSRSRSSSTSSVTAMPPGL